MLLPTLKKQNVHVIIILILMLWNLFYAAISKGIDEITHFFNFLLLKAVNTCKWPDVEFIVSQIDNIVFLHYDLFDLCFMNFI